MDRLRTACPEMTALSHLIGSFAALLTSTDGNTDRLTAWIDTARQHDRKRNRASFRATLTTPHSVSNSAFTKGLSREVIVLYPLSPNLAAACRCR